MENKKIYLVWSFGLTFILFTLSLLIFQVNEYKYFGDLRIANLALQYSIAWLISFGIALLRFRYKKPTDFNVLSIYGLFLLLCMWVGLGDPKIEDITTIMVIFIALIALIPTFIVVTAVWKMAMGG